MDKFREILKEKFGIICYRRGRETRGGGRGGDSYEPPPGIEIIPSWSAKAIPEKNG